MSLGDRVITGPKPFWCRVGFHRPRWVPFRRVACIRCGKEY